MKELGWLDRFLQRKVSSQSKSEHAIIQWIWRWFVSFGLWGLVLATLFWRWGAHSLVILLVMALVVWLYERTERVSVELWGGLEERLKGCEEARKALEKELSETRKEAQRAHRIKSSFLANMSHELRTPLNAIIGYSELLLDDLPPEEAQVVGDDLKKIHRSGMHLLDLINDILDISKIESGRIDISPEQREVRALVEELDRAIQPQLSRNKNTLEIQCEPDVGSMNTDFTRLHQILINLLSNACKFTHEGKILFAVERFSQAEEPWIRFRVKDSGIGMSEQEMENIFDAFTQADHLSSRKYGGTGLGLAISRRLAQMLGGDIGVESVEGEGSTFTLELPCEAPEARQIRESLAQRAPTGVTAFAVDRPLVLVIDDDPNVHDLMSRLLRRENYNVVTAFNGEEGLRLAKELRPAVITLDALMPGMSGWDVLAALKSHPSLSQTPVVMISISDQVQRGYALGVSEFLTKPIDRDRLTRLLEQFRVRKQRGSVLIVEDDERTRELLVRLLERNGWDTLEAPHGKAALEVLETQTPALILSDLMMPHMDGFELIEVLAKDERWCDIPVVVLTAMELAPDDLARLNDHIESILQKGAWPLEELEEQLLATLHERLEARHQNNGHDTKEKKDG